MGRPLKIKDSSTGDTGFNPWSALVAPSVPDGVTPNSATEYPGVVGGARTVASATFPVVRCRVFIAGQSEEDGVILRQKGTTKYLVKGVSSSAEGVCVLADESDGALTEGNMNITFTTGDSTATNIARLTNRWAVDYSGNRYLINFDTDEGTAVKSGAANNATVDLGIIEKYTS